MGRRLATIFIGLTLAPAAFAWQHKAQAIDRSCQQLRQAFASATPFVFAGPDPWTEIDDLPAKMPDDAVAYVYATGASVRWVFIRITDPDQGWSEDIDYFFREDGTLMKRDRRVQSVAANIALQVTTYYADGAVLKERSREQALRPGPKDFSQFSDPDAPKFDTTDDLPFPEIEDLFRRLG